MNTINTYETNTIPQKPKPPQKMSKARAMELAGKMKRWLVVASFVGFGSFSGLAASHIVGATSTASTSHTSSQKSSGSSSSNILNQSSSSNFGSSNTSSSSSSSSSSSTVSSGTSVS